MLGISPAKIVNDAGDVQGDRQPRFVERARKESGDLVEAVDEGVDALLYSYTLWAPTIIVPLFAAVLFGIRSAPAALSGIAAGAIVTVIWQWVLPAPFGLDDGLIPGVLANLIVFTVVATATANRYPPRRQPAPVPQGEFA